jgi:HAD superfamily hydrolase (TIGR01549 family)
MGRNLLTLDTVVLDVDGTLVDSVYARTIAWKAAFREVGVEVPSHRIHRAIGMGGDRVVAHLAGDAVAQGVGDEVARRQTEHFERLIPEVSATEGAADLLSLLRERGLRVVIASSGEPHITSRLLELVDGAPGLVHRIDGGSLTARSKPAPDLLHAAVESVGGTEAIVIGDSVWDTRAAAAAGLPCLAVRTGGFDDAELMANGATAVYENPGELLKAPELWG